MPGAHGPRVSTLEKTLKRGCQRPNCNSQSCGMLVVRAGYLPSVGRPRKRSSMVATLNAVHLGLTDFGTRHNIHRCHETL